MISLNKKAIACFYCPIRRQPALTDVAMYRTVRPSRCPHNLFVFDQIDMNATHVLLSERFARGSNLFPSTHRSRLKPAGSLDKRSAVRGEVPHAKARCCEGT